MEIVATVCSFLGGIAAALISGYAGFRLADRRHLARELAAYIDPLADAVARLAAVLASPVHDAPNRPEDMLARELLRICRNVEALICAWDICNMRIASRRPAILAGLEPIDRIIAEIAERPILDGMSICEAQQKCRQMHTCLIKLYSRILH